MVGGNSIAQVEPAMGAHREPSVSDIRLVIAASPIALGNLRKAMSDHVRKTVVAELDKDLTNVPTPQLDRHLDGIIAV